MGIYIFERSADIRRLSDERDQLTQQLESLMLGRPNVNILPETPSKTFTTPSSKTPSVLRFEEVEDDGSLENLVARRTRGEYINLFDDPANRNKLRENIVRGVALLEAKNRSTLIPLFNAMGIPDTESSRLIAHVSEINEAALEAQAMTTQLLAARDAYDEKIKTLLSPADYERYKEFEEGAPARAAVEELRKYADKDGKVIDTAELETIGNVIKDAKAYERIAYLGPYDGMPVVAVGKDNVLRNAEERLAELHDGANRALRIAAERGLSMQSIDLMFNYFERNVREKSEEIDRIQDPLTEARLLGDLQRRAREDMQRSPGEQKLKH